MGPDQNPKISEERYRSIVENATEGILVMQGGERVYYNPCWLELTGYSDEAYQAVKALSLIHPEDIDRVNQAYEDVISGEKYEPSLEFRLIPQSGRIKNLEAKVSRIEWEGKLAGMIFVKDITERIVAEQKLKESEKKLNLIIDTSPIGIGTVDEFGKFTTTNTAYEQMIGYSKEECRELSLFNVTHPDDRPGNKELFQSMLFKNTDGFFLEKRYIRKDGVIINVAVHATGIADADGNIKFGTAFIIDMTERKKEEEALRLSEARFSSAFYDSPIPLMLLDYDTGVRININDQFMKIFGYTKKDLVGNNFLQKTIAVNKEQVEKSIRLIRENSFYQHLPFEIRTKSGEIKQVLVSASKIGGENESIFLNSYLDITERKRAEDELEKYRNHLEELVKQRTEELEEKMKEKSELFDMMIGREVRMAELKKVIKALRKQLKDNEIKPIANDPLLGDIEE